MDRRTLALVAAGLVIAFLLGFVPEWMAKRNADRELAEARQELRLSRLQGRLGAAMAESLRSNYERSRQLMARYFTDLQATVGQVDPRRRQALSGILSQRDEIITLLSRNQPESSQRLMILYTQMFSAIDPEGAVAPAVTTAPAPPAVPAPPPAAPPAAPAPAKPAGARP